MWLYYLYAIECILVNVSVRLILATVCTVLLIKYLSASGILQCVRLITSQNYHTFETTI